MTIEEAHIQLDEAKSYYHKIEIALRATLSEVELTSIKNPPTLQILEDRITAALKARAARRSPPLIAGLRPSPRGVGFRCCKCRPPDRPDSDGRAKQWCCGLWISGPCEG